MAGEDVFDVLVLGAGPAGQVVAGRAVRQGLSAAIVERRLVGGECNFYACVPSKSLLVPMELAAAVRRMPGLELAGPIDARAVLGRRDEFAGHYDNAAQVSWVESVQAGFVRGQGRLAGPLPVDVTAPDRSIRALRARHAVVLATGSDPRIPDVPGLREARPWTNREAVSAQQVPMRLVVIGGGPVGCEISQALHALVAREVTMLVAGHRLLERAEPFAGDLLARSFQESGIDVRFASSAARIERRSPAAR